MLGLLKRLWRTVAFLPLGLAVSLGGEATRRDIRRQLQPRLDLPLPESVSFTDRLEVLAHRPFRSILYQRLRVSGTAGRILAGVLGVFFRGEPALFITCADIGPGFMMMHGFATIITARRIGTDCQVAQQVTIGYDDRGAPPVLGDRVRVGAGATLIGPIEIGDDAVIGAGAVVVRDVPAGKVVGGVPARVIEGAADRYGARKAAEAGSGGQSDQ